MGSRVGELRRQNMNKPKREGQIIRQVALGNANGITVTRNWIANRLALSVSPYLRHIIAHLVAMDVIRYKLVKHWNGNEKYSYFLNWQGLERHKPELYKQLMTEIGKQEMLPL